MAHSKHGEKVQRFYNSKAWRQARHLCVVRCRGRCQQCGKPGKEVHHIIPLDEKNVDDLTKVCEEKGYEVFKISAATGEGLKELFRHVSEVIKTLRSGWITTGPRVKNFEKQIEDSFSSQDKEL